jgi:transketolase
LRDSFVRALTELTAEDPSIVLITGDLGFGVLNDYITRYPDNFVNAGVAEQNMTALACGMALTGARAYTYSIGNFPTLRCLEQLRNDVCYHDANVTVVAVGAGFSYGQLGMSHFATEDLAILRALPGMRVVAPSDPWQAYALTRQLHAEDGPVYLRIDKGSAGLPPGPVTFGKVRQVRDGGDAVIFATGGILGEVMAAAQGLAEQGASIRVIDVHTLKPLDIEGICAAAHHSGRVITVEEHVVTGGLGGAVAEACLEGGVAVKAFRRIGLGAHYPEIVGDQAYLRAQYRMDRNAIAAAVGAMLGL